MHRLAPLVTLIGVILACVVTVTLRNADPELAGAAIVASVLIAGIGVGASVGSQSPRR